MSNALRLRLGVVAAAFSCLVAGYAVAQQQTQTPDQIKPAQSRDASDRAASGQSDRAGTQQGERSPSENAGRSSAQRHTANFRGTPAAAGQAVEQHLAGCLLTKNQAEIEINEFAQQHSQNPQVKQFAQQMVADHRKISEQLQQIAGTSGAGQGARTEYERERETSNTTRLPGSPGAGRPDSSSDTTATTDDVNVNVNRNENENASLTVAKSSNADNGALMQLAAIEKKITQQCTQALREELQQKNGPEFDECYLASQVGGHMHMLAALEVIGQDSQGELQQIAEKARPTVQKHLEHAKQLMKQMKAGSGERVGQVEKKSTRTER